MKSFACGDSENSLEARKQRNSKFWLIESIFSHKNVFLALENSN